MALEPRDDIRWETMADYEAQIRTTSHAMRRRLANPRMAESTADIGRYYPKLSPAVVTAAAAAGFHYLDPRLQGINEKILADQAQTMGLSPPPGIWNTLKGYAGNVSSTLFLILDGIFRETGGAAWGRYLTNVLAATTDEDAGENPWEVLTESAKGAFGTSPLALAMGAIAQGKSVSTGQGWRILPQMGLSPESEQAIMEDQNFYQAIENPAQAELGVPVVPFSTAEVESKAPRVAGIGPPGGYGLVSKSQPGRDVGRPGLPVTPGRLLAFSADLEPGTDAWTAVSGITDVMLGWRMDLSAVLMKQHGQIGKNINALAPDPVPPVEQAATGAGGIAADFASSTPSLQQALVSRGRRPVVKPRTADQWADSWVGDQFLDDVTGSKDFKRIHGWISPSTRGHTDPKRVLDLLDSDDKALTRQLFTDMIRDEDITKVFTPQTWSGRYLAGGRASVTGAAAEALGMEGASVYGVRRAFRQNHSGGWLDRMASEITENTVDAFDPGQAVTATDSIAAIWRMSHSRRSYYMEKMARATTTPGDVKGASNAVLREMAYEAGERLTKAGYSPEAAKAVTNYFDETIALDDFWRKEMAKEKYGRVKVVSFNGKKIAVPDPTEDFAEYMARTTRLPPYKAVRSTMRRVQLAEKFRIRFKIPELGDYQAPALSRALDIAIGKVWKREQLIRFALPIRLMAEEQARITALGLPSLYHYPFYYLNFISGRRWKTPIGTQFTEHQQMIDAGAATWGDVRINEPRFSKGWTVEGKLRADGKPNGAYLPATTHNYITLAQNPVAASIAADGVKVTLDRIRGLVPDRPGSPNLRLYIDQATRGQMSDAALLGWLENLEARIHQVSGGRWWGKDPRRKGRWIDDRSKTVDRRKASTRATMNSSSSSHFIIATPGDGRLISGIANGNLDGLPLLGFDAVTDRKALDQLGRHLGDNYLDSLPPVVRTPVYDAERAGLLDRASGTMLHGLYHVIDLVDRFPVMRMFVASMLGRMLPAADDLTRQKLLAWGVEHNIRMPGIKGWYEAKLDPTGAALQGLNWLAGDAATLAHRVGPVVDPLFRAGNYVLAEAGLNSSKTFNTWWDDIRQRLLSNYQDGRLPAYALRTVRDSLSDSEVAVFDEVVELVYDNNFTGLMDEAEELVSPSWAGGPTLFHGARRNAPLPTALGPAKEGMARHGAEPQLFATADAWYARGMSKAIESETGHLYTLHWQGKGTPNVLDSMAPLKPAQRAVTDSFINDLIVRSGLEGTDTAHRVREVLSDPNLSYDQLYRGAMSKLMGKAEVDIYRTGVEWNKLLVKMKVDVIQRPTEYLLTRPHMFGPEDVSELYSPPTLPRSMPEVDDLYTAMAGDVDQGLRDATEIAMNYALEELRNILYSAKTKHNWADIMRWFHPFGEAWYEIVSTWSRIVRQNPQVLERGRFLVDQARENGWTYTDPDTGEVVYNYPIPFLPSWMTQGQAQIEMTGKLAGLNLATGSGLPGASPLLQLAASAIRPFREDPGWKWLRDYIIPFGPSLEDPTVGGVIDSTIPPWFRRGMLAISDPKFLDGRALVQFQDMVSRMYVIGLNNGEWEDTPEGQAEGLKISEGRARLMFAIQMVVQGAGPTGTYPRFEVEIDPALDPTGQIFTFQALASEWQNMRDEAGGDEAVAFDNFYSTFGLDPTLFATGRSVLIRPQSMTEQGLAFAQSPIGKRLNKDYPLTAYFVMPDPEDAELDTAAWNKQWLSGDRLPINPQQWALARNRMLGEIAFQAAQNKVLGPNGKVRGDPEAAAYLRMIRDQLTDRYPGFNREIGGMPTRVDTDSLRDEFEGTGTHVGRGWAQDPYLSQTDAGRALLEYLMRRDQVIEIAASRGITPTGLATADRAQDLREYLLRQAQILAERSGPDGGPNPAWVSIFDRAYASEVEDKEHQLQWQGNDYTVVGGKP